MAKPNAIYLQDYTPPEFLIDQVELRFELAEEATEVQARLQLRRNPAGSGQQALILHGQELELLHLTLDGRPLARGDYQLDAQQLTLPNPPEQFTLESRVRLYPQRNTSLEGLYQSSGVCCTQCEADGFRKITYFLDRPDVMAKFSTTLVADPDRYPVLLSNGNPVDSGVLDDGRHWATWHDPFKKPSYLFALVAGPLAHLEDYFTTRSGRRVTLRIYTEPQHLDQCEHAMRSLQHAMRWDEEVFGLEYDLDIYNIVAVSDFNMGAMENKGLNVFNTKFVLAKPETATDDDYQGVEAVIAHEYFHNWTGNRVTCRDWFQLSLKEGLTVFRDQEFSADMGSRGVKRIEDVRILRSVQFPQDAGPMAHPVRPDSYIEINNFYTVTVYNKGAEVVRMIHNLLGRDGFRRGMDLYFQRHDGQAVTCDDFVAAMADANQVDLSQFKHWYSQAGTPLVQATSEYDPATASYTLTLRQSCPPTPGQPQKQPFHIPFAMGLLAADGQPLPLQLEGENTASEGDSRVLELRAAEQSFRFVNVPEQPIPSLLRGFSAPLKLEYDYSDDELAFLLAHDSDDFNRWEAAQQLAIRSILALRTAHQAQRPLQLPDKLITAYRQALCDDTADPALRAHILSLPGEVYLAEQMDVIDVDGLHFARETMRKMLAQALQNELLSTYEQFQSRDQQTRQQTRQQASEHHIDPASIGRRSLKNRCLDYLMLLPEHQQLGMTQFRNANNMTDQLAALQTLAQQAHPQREQALADFYQQWRHEALVVDKWLSLQATAQGPDTLQQVQSLLQHEAFTIKNPNKVRALIGAFCHNPIHFHAASGAGYQFVADQVLALNALNPQIAARLLGSFTRWRKYDTARQDLMRSHLQRILASTDLSPDVYEIAAKSLDTA